MNVLNAISDAGGWQMAALGVGIVFLSLIVLSIIISQLHNVLELWDSRKSLLQKSPQPDSVLETRPPAKLPHPSVCPEDILKVADLWAPLIRQLDDRFRLQDLYEKAAANNFPHPHLTINRLRQAGMLVLEDNGLFTWNANAKDADCNG
jgi:hypothetical protein